MKKSKATTPGTNLLNKNRLKMRILRHWQFYMLIALPLAIILVFSYYPMYGITLAFKDFNFRAGIMGSEWAGLKYIEAVFTTPNMLRYVTNTLLLSVLNLVWSFPFPIILALAINNVKNSKFKKTVQMITYAPHFISVVVMVGILYQVFALRGGLVNTFIVSLGGEAINFMGEQDMFRTIYIGSGIWQNMGYSAIIYIAALSGVDPNLYEAADLDGATKFQKVIHVDLPTIAPTIIILLILSAGNILSIGFEKVFLMQNPLNLTVSEIISTYVYKIGLQSAQYSLSTAIGLLNSLVNLTILFIVNRIAGKVSETSLW